MELTEKANWIKTKLRRLNWNGQNLEDWIELWSNIEGVICNLAYIFFKLWLHKQLQNNIPVMSETMSLCLFHVKKRNGKWSSWFNASPIYSASDSLSYVKVLLLRFSLLATVNQSEFSIFQLLCYFFVFQFFFLTPQLPLPLYFIWFVLWCSDELFNLC